MTDFLDQFGHQLDLAVARRIAGRRPARRVLPALATALVVAAVVVSVLTIAGGGRQGERPATDNAATPALGSLQDVPAPPPGLADIPVVIANGTPVSGLAASYATQLRSAGWTVGAATNAGSQDVSESFVTGPGSDELSEVFGLEVGEAELGSEDGALAIVLGRDAAPEDEPHYWDPRPGKQPGSACLVLRNLDELPLSSCGVLSSAAEPLGLVTVATLPDGGWLVYGYASDQTKSVRVGNGEPFATELKRGVPGRFFHTAVPEQPSVYVVALDGAGTEIGSVGSLTPTNEKLTSKDEARQAGDLAGFAPSISVNDYTFIFEGNEISPGEARKQGLDCGTGSDAIVTCVKP